MGGGGAEGAGAGAGALTGADTGGVVVAGFSLTTGAGGKVTAGGLLCENIVPIGFPVNRPDISVESAPGPFFIA